MKIRLYFERFANKKKITKNLEVNVCGSNQKVIHFFCATNLKEISCDVSIQNNQRNTQSYYKIHGFDSKQSRMNKKISYLGEGNTHLVAYDL